MPEKSPTSLRILLGLGIIYTLYLAHELILPIVLALIASLVLSPLVIQAKKHWRLPKPVTSLALLLVLVLLLGGLVTSITAPALDWIEKAPESISRLLVGESHWQSQLDRINESARQLEESVESLSSGQTQTVILQTDSWRSQLASSAQKTLVGLALALVLTYFLLVNGDRLLLNAIRQVASSQRRPLLIILRSSRHQVAGFLAIFTLTNLSVGLIMGIVAWLVGLPTPALWGVVAGLSRFIPYLGVMAAAALLTLVSVTSLDALSLIIVTPLTYLALTSLVGTLVEPYIYGFRMAVNPIAVFLSIFFWGWLWGPVGFFLAVPLMTIIQVVLAQVPSLRPLYKIIAR